MALSCSWWPPGPHHVEVSVATIGVMTWCQERQGREKLLSLDNWTVPISILTQERDGTEVILQSDKNFARVDKKEI